MNHAGRIAETHSWDGGGGRGRAQERAYPPSSDRTYFLVEL